MSTLSPNHSGVFSVPTFIAGGDGVPSPMLLPSLRSPTSVSSTDPQACLSGSHSSSVVLRLRRELSQRSAETDLQEANRLSVSGTLPQQSFTHAPLLGNSAVVSDPPAGTLPPTNDNAFGVVVHDHISDDEHDHMPDTVIQDVPPHTDHEDAGNLLCGGKELSRSVSRTMSTSASRCGGSPTDHSVTTAPVSRQSSFGGHSSIATRPLDPTTIVFQTSALRIGHPRTEFTVATRDCDFFLTLPCVAFVLDDRLVIDIAEDQDGDGDGQEAQHHRVVVPFEELRVFETEHLRAPLIVGMCVTVFAASDQHDAGGGAPIFSLDATDEHAPALQDLVDHACRRHTRFRQNFSDRTGQQLMVPGVALRCRSMNLHFQHELQGPKPPPT